MAESLKHGGDIMDKFMRLNKKLHITIGCALFFIVCSGINWGKENKAGSPDGNKPAAKSNIAARDSNGPVVKLSYSKIGIQKNPASSFLYFIPLISPVSVVRETSADNEQQEGIILYERTAASKSFYAACKFEMLGKGFQKCTFDPAEMIARNTGDLKKGEPLTNILGWIKFEGEGTGLFEVRGTINGSQKTVTEVIVNFNEGGQSPVTAGLYSVKPQNGQYKYENKYNEIIVRINTLTFEKSEDDPRMDIKISSIRNKTDDENFWGAIKGAIANLFIKPLEVAKLGNDTMLNLGKALEEKQTAFNFPKANNIEEDKVVKTETEW